MHLYFYMFPTILLSLYSTLLYSTITQSPAYSLNHFFFFRHINTQTHPCISIYISNFHAPVEDMLKEGINVLDSGCGPATWTFEIGENYPRSRIYGVDASCVFPENVKPANVEFAIGNIAKRIPHEDCMFHYIHQRLLIMGLTDEDWTNALKEHYRILKPGGYIESVEVGITMQFSSPFLYPLSFLFLKKNLIVTERRGVVLNIAYELKDRFAQAGFENIVQKVVSIPFNHSGKIGQLMWDDFQELCQSIRPALIKANPELDGEGVFEHCLKECARESNEFKNNVEFFVVYAQKPSSQE
ncbi:S-adenosyl-L-methionine-dependent methyltransferase [Blakeslea trispora]|nr:S-adenosyl-L-methionine-dependent methyltransferase [Blakeslea trispora]